MSNVDNLTLFQLNDNYAYFELHIELLWKD